MARLRVHDLCGYRSGDKGDIANVALLADDAAAYEVLAREVTAARVRDHFGELVTGEVVRYEAPNVLALNFVLHGALGGGGPRSLRSDALGKTLGGALVRLEIDVPDALAPEPREQTHGSQIGGGGGHHVHQLGLVGGRHDDEMVVGGVELPQYVSKARVESVGCVPGSFLQKT